jgi:hypothetical protein
MDYKFNKGSEWRKWDLHVHTPASLVHNYKANKKNDDVWESYIQDIESLPIDIKVLGINDYIFIDGYKKVLDYKKIGRLPNIDLILPVIELRLAKFAGNKQFKRINYHIIFSNEISADIIQSQFINGLSSSYKLDPESNQCSWGGVITPENLANLGKAIKANVPAEKIKDYGSDLEEGFNNLNIEITDIENQLKKGESFFKGRYLTAIGKTEWDSFCWDDGSIAEKKTIINEANIVFTAAETIDIFQKGKIKLKNSKVNDLLLDCSDAHYNSWSENKDRIGNCFTWIKADPTFEGLKQILCEPESRVRIQDSNPESKLSYNIIEKVKFVDNSGIKKFPDYEIGFNPDLNAIIGGKSSGKSLLMHIIAKSLGNNIDTKVYADVLENVSLEVYYADDPNKKRTSEDRRIIEFLPQLHIERIVQDKTSTSANSNRTNYFNKFITELIRQDEEINELFEIHNRVLKESQKILEDNIGNWIKLDKDLSQARKELLPLGDKTAISNEIANIQQKVKDLTQKSGLTDEEIKLYQELTASNSIIYNSISTINIKKSEIILFITYLQTTISSAVDKSITFDTNNEVIIKLFNEFKQKINATIYQESNILIGDLNTIQGELSQKEAKLSMQLSLNNKQLEPILEKNKIQTEIRSFESNIETEKKKLLLIEDKEKEIANIQGSRDAIYFIEYYSNIIEAYNSLKDSINEKIASKWGNEQTKLTLTASSVFDSNMFVDSIGSIINLRSYLENQFVGCGFDASNYIYSEDNHIQNIEKITGFCIRDVNRFDYYKNGRNLEELLRAIFKNCNYIDFDIKKGDDCLSNMSEGKKGIVILQLYLSLSKADYPILIDQPEDNLDNRTVYVELNDYIKQCKQTRQIIIVSHNANLVVNTDAENVIVANQAGEDGKDNLEFKFEYVNGSLENTFTDAKAEGILYTKGIREHVCEILEGGTDAFRKREEKYHLK